ncbi:MAG: hypothetical protein K5793_08935 [Nitrosarchaeum sp.]|nr:hypothetical protein [Nitrosarchaeum sp.]
MKTVSTKLEKSEFNRLVEMCNHDGQCISEALREMIKRDLEAHDDYIYSEMKRPIKELKIPRAEAKIKKISYDDGKTWIDV